MPPSRLNVFHRQLAKYALIRSCTVIIVGVESVVAGFSFPYVVAEVRFVTARCRGRSPIVVGHHLHPLSWGRANSSLAFVILIVITIVITIFSIIVIAIVITIVITIVVNIVLVISLIVIVIVIFIVTSVVINIVAIT